MSRLQPDTFYHIYNHANGADNLFREEKNYHYFLQQWEKYILPIADTYAYCLMPNHFHTLIKIKNIEMLSKNETFESILRDPTSFENLSGLISKQFGNFFNSYAKAFNKMYDRRGSLFNSPFKAKEISSDVYLSNVIFYIHHNPVHHGFVPDIGDWPYSSYHSLLSDKPTNLQRGYVQKWFNGRGEMKKFHLKSMKGLELLELEFT